MSHFPDKQLKEEKARLIMERQVFEDRGSAFNKVSAELESLKAKHTALVEEATSLRSKVGHVCLFCLISFLMLFLNLSIVIECQSVFLFFLFNHFLFSISFQFIIINL